MAAFPGALATFAGFVASHTLSVDNHAAQHNLEQAEILAAQTKLGTGASTPTANKVLTGTGVGTSSWSQVDLTTTVTGVLPVANGGTGQGNLTSLPLVSPIITGGGSWTGSPTISSPTITDLTNANHTHASASQGGLLNGANAILDGTITPAELTAGTGSSWVWTEYSAISTIIGWSSFSEKTIRYIQVGKTVYVSYGLNGTSNSTLITFTVPIAALVGTFPEAPTGFNQDNGASQTTPARIFIDPSSNTTLVNITKTMGTAVWTNSGNKIVRGLFIYEAA